MKNDTAYQVYLILVSMNGGEFKESLYAGAKDAIYGNVYEPKSDKKSYAKGFYFGRFIRFSDFPLRGIVSPEEGKEWDAKFRNSQEGRSYYALNLE